MRKMAEYLAVAVVSAFVSTMTQVHGQDIVGAFDRLRVNSGTDLYGGATVQTGALRANAGTNLYGGATVQTGALRANAGTNLYGGATVQTGALRANAGTTINGTLSGVPWSLRVDVGTLLIDGDSSTSSSVEPNVALRIDNGAIVLDGQSLGTGTNALHVLQGGVRIRSWDGMLAHFTGPCPTGWAEHTAARGRVLVGLPSGGTNGGTQGSALANRELRRGGSAAGFRAGSLSGLSYTPGRFTRISYTPGRYTAPSFTPGRYTRGRYSGGSVTFPRAAAAGGVHAHPFTAGFLATRQLQNVDAGSDFGLTNLSANTSREGSHTHTLSSGSYRAGSFTAGSYTAGRLSGGSYTAGRLTGGAFTPGRLSGGSYSAGRYTDQRAPAPYIQYRLCEYQS